MGDYMEQSKAREIISSLSSLYPLKDYEEEAIKELLNPKETVWSPEVELSVCPNCRNEHIFGYTDNFCSKCGQPIMEDEL